VYGVEICGPLSGCGGFDVGGSLNTGGAERSERLKHILVDKLEISVWSDLNS